MSARLDRGLMLFQQSRYELAEKEFRGALAEDPQNAMSHAFLAYCLTERGLHDEAEQEGKEAVQLAPDAAFTHYVLARVFYNRDLYPEAERAIFEAIRLDPDDADHHALYKRRFWPTKGVGSELCTSCRKRGRRLNPRGCPV